MRRSRRPRIMEGGLREVRRVSMRDFEGTKNGHILADAAMEVFFSEAAV